MTKQELFETHGKILLQAAGRRGWRTMPEGGTEAIEAGLVQESDPTWMYSDDHRACNGFTLTDLGREIMVERGYICQCAGCVHERFGPTVTDQQYCRNCQASIQQYGATETPAGTSCKFHARMMQDKQESP